MNHQTNHLSYLDKVAMLSDAINYCDRWWADILDCRVSLARQKIDVSFEDILAKFTERSHCSVIYRPTPENYLEVGFRSETDPDYFLWIIISEHSDEFIKKWRLNAMYNL
jgi:hypothetical protein